MKVIARDFFTSEEQDDIKLAIMNSELDTSGEIRVHIESVCKGEVLDRAAYMFKKLGMAKTAERNGVLIYLAISNRKFAIIGDSGIHNKVPPDFWDNIKLKMLDFFREGNFSDGLIYAISETGIHLKQYFPHSKDDVNELPDDISFGKK
jgi:uncharacterized membrane protein